jgi:chromate transporter
LSEAAATGATRRPESAMALLLAFNSLALQGFGGVLPVAQRELVERRGWLTREQFAQTLSVSQVLPGPNIVNMALIIGDGFFGWRGAFAALAGLVAAPLVIVLALAVLYANVADEPRVTGAIRGMGAVAAGLVLAMAVKLAPTLRANPLPLALCALVCIATWLLVGVLRVPLVHTVLGLGGATVAVAAWWLGRARGASS